MYKGIWIAIVVLVALGAWFAYNKKEPAAPTADTPIKIGAVLSLTGIAADFGEAAKKSMEIAVDEINRNGGISGRTVTLVIEDDRTDPKAAISAFKKLTDVDKVDAVVGGIFDFATIPLLPLADSAKVAFLAPTEMRIEGGLIPSEHSFVMMPDFSKVIRELKTYLAQNETKKLAVVHFKSVFGTQIATTLSEVMGELGRGPIVDESYNAIGANDFRTTVAKLKQQEVDTVFLDMVDIDPVTFLSRARELDYHPQVISYYGFTDSFAAQDRDKSLLEGAVILDWESSSPRFSELYEKRYDTPAVHSAEKSYMGIYVVANAVAATEKREEVAAYLASHSFETPSGTVTFNADHAVDSTTVKINVVKDGKLVPLP
ncbi:ABC transporter substrate-binding protein [Candidatus Kaiserbacteria bacterium]|nr:ABC transporter substrate-binding protein [Candidatus Kaiserbacteria bacterium]